MREPLIPQLDAEEFLHWEARQMQKHGLHHGFVVAFAGGTIDRDTIAFNLRSKLSSPIWRRRYDLTRLRGDRARRNRRARVDRVAKRRYRPRSARRTTGIAMAASAA
jgi:hypothetical protein